MIKSRYFKTDFNNKEELFKALRENNSIIIDAKKAEIIKSCEKGVSIVCKSLKFNNDTEETKALAMDENYYYIAVSSSYILDSHDDLHLKGMWKKSISEQQGKNYLVCDHDLEINNVIVRKEHIEMLTATIPFSMLGKPYNGNTEVLIYKFLKSKVIHPIVKEWLESGDDIEASVRMRYIDIVFCMDSNDPLDKVYKDNYDNYIGLIANKEDFEYIHYFYAIKEAQNVRESSLLPFGSNHATGLVSNNKQEPLDNTLEKTEPSDDTQTTEMLKQLLNKF
jgi:hypothetical protein